MKKYLTAKIDKFQTSQYYSKLVEIDSNFLIMYMYYLLQ